MSGEEGKIRYDQWGLYFVDRQSEEITASMSWHEVEALVDDGQGAESQKKDAHNGIMFICIACRWLHCNEDGWQPPNCERENELADRLSHGICLDCRLQLS